MTLYSKPEKGTWELCTDMLIVSILNVYDLAMEELRLLPLARLGLGSQAQGKSISVLFVVL